MAENRLRRAVVEVGVAVNALGDDGRLAGVGGEPGERLRAGLLDVSEALLRRVGSRLLNRRDWNRDGLRAVDELGRVVAEDSHLLHGL